MTRQYIGARYVPKFFENSATHDATWAENTPYEPLTIVTWNNLSYTSKMKVPSTVGAPNLNTDYWVLTGDYSGSIGNLIQRMDTAEDDIDSLEGDVDVLQAHEEYFLFPTGNTNDRSADVMEKLTTYGVCYFASGDFWFSQEITMPQGTSLMGMGDGTRLHLNYNGVLIRMNSYCYVHGLRLIGQETEIPFSPFSKGDRVGIYIDGDAGSGSSTFTHNYNIVSDVLIKNFNGSAIKCYRTGGASNAATVNNVVIVQCHTAIDIPIRSEFNTFTGVFVDYCNVGCVMQGGNNTFSGCSFKSCITTVLVDNINDDLINPDHSTFSGCIFAHAGTDNNGDLLYMRGVKFGIAFSGCNFWHGNVNIEESYGIVMTGNIFGIPERTFKLLNCTGCIVSHNKFFSSNPTLNLNNSEMTFTDNNGADGYPIDINVVSYPKLVSQMQMRASKYLTKGDFASVTQGFACCNSTGTYYATIVLPFETVNTNYNVTINSIILMGVGSVDPSDVTEMYKGLNFIVLEIPSSDANEVGKCRACRVSYTLST